MVIAWLCLKGSNIDAARHFNSKGSLVLMQDSLKYIKNRLIDAWNLNESVLDFHNSSIGKLPLDGVNLI